MKCNVTLRILGAEWEMSKVGIPPPHDPSNPHALVARINNINNINQMRLYLIITISNKRITFWKENCE